MAFLYITEFAELAIGPAGRVGSMGVMPPVAEQTIASNAASAQSAAFNAKTRFVRLHADTQITAVAFGTNPTAVAGAGGSARMAANQTEYFAVPLGAGFKVAAINAT